MPEALASLTLRGRTFLAGGLTAIVCGVVLGQSPLLMMGVLAGVLPLLAALVVSRARHQLTLERTVTPALVEAGRPATVTLALTNESRAPTGTLLLEEHVAYVLGARPRFVVDGVGRGWQRQLDYQVRADVRGRHEVGPMTMRVTDPFGMVEIGRAFHSRHAITVVPRTVPLTPVHVDGARTGSGDNRSRAFATGSAEDVTVREYRLGDDLRRVHWRTSARAEKLMVRREEQPWQARATVVLDNRALAHAGRGAASSLEEVVSVAASVTAHLVARGHDVRLVTAAGPTASTSGHQRVPAANLGPLLETLAVVEPDSRTVMDSAWLREPGSGEQVVAVLGRGRVDDQAFLDQLRRHAVAPIALVVDVDSRAPVNSTGLTTAPSGTDDTSVNSRDRVRMLRAQGWRAGLVNREDPLDRTWQAVAR